MSGIIAVVAIVGIVGFFAWANYQTRRNHAAFKKDDVIAALENVLNLDDSGYHDEWDLFLSWPIDDPHLESIRQRCLQIALQYPSGPEGDIGSKEGQREIKRMLDELRAT